MGQKVTLDLDVIEQAEFSCLAKRVSELEGSVASARTNVADHERELTLLRASVQNIQQWIAERALEKFAAQTAAKSSKYAAPVEEGADDAPPSPGPAVARACPKGATKVWLGLTKMQAEDLLKLVGNVQGHGRRRDRTYTCVIQALWDEAGIRYTVPEPGSTLRVERGSL